MKKFLFIINCLGLLAGNVQAQLQNQSSYIRISGGSYLVAQNGVINANSATLTNDGTLTTPANLSNTTGATLQGNGQYHIGANWSNTATFNAGTSTVSFEGDQHSTVTSGGGAFYLLVLNKSGGNNLLLADDMEVGNNLDFQATDNYVVLGNNNLEVADLSGYDASRHVRTDGTGSLARNVGATPVDFPVGNSSYNPATLTNAGTPDFYLVRVSDAVLSGGNTGSPITADAVGRGWFVEENTAGGSDLNLTLQWNGAEELASFDRTNAYIAHFLASSWDTQPTASATGADPYTLSRSGITSLSPFAVFDGDFSALIDISGIIRWEHDGASGVKDANVALTGDDTDSDITPIAGTYTLVAANGSNFTVTPTKNINKLNGITVADATAIQQHVTGINPITSPYKQVAADVNKSNSITTFDASVINQALLGNPAALAQFKTSWRFVPVTHTMALPPWGFPEKISLAGVSGSAPGQDFWGIKTGDVVDVYANPANLIPHPPLVLRANDAILEAGQELSVTFRADQFADLAAWQFALLFDPERLELTGIEPNSQMPLTAEHFGLYNIAEGVIRAAWAQAVGISLHDAEVVFSVKFNVLQSGGKLRDALSLDETSLPAYAYNSALEESGVALVYDQASSVVAGSGLALGLDIWPNPFVGHATARFFLPEPCMAQLRVVDATGRELWRVRKNCPSGWQQEAIRLDGMTGALVCELTTPLGTERVQIVAVE
ncbi:MAG: hypothetical protein IPM36_08185 [Lewinellaceae bacterium]|nr:hypothetical protein [Lewinellaceae bacterium]